MNTISIKIDDKDIQVQSGSNVAIYGDKKIYLNKVIWKVKDVDDSIIAAIDSKLEEMSKKRKTTLKKVAKTDEE